MLIIWEMKIIYPMIKFQHDFSKKKKICLDNTYYYDFWRSCDTEDWSNDAENSALINYILLYILYIF